MAKSKVSVASSTVETVETVETQTPAVAVEEKKKRGRKASKTFDHEVGETKVSIEPVIFSVSELTREELEELATAKIRAIAYAKFKVQMSKKLPAIDTSNKALAKLKEQFPQMEESQIIAMASIVDKNFTLAPPTEWSFTVEDFRAKSDEDESDES